MKQSKGEALLAFQLKSYKIPFEAEHRFSPPRKWRFDFILTIPDKMIAIEVEGGVYSRGRHLRPKGYLSDIEKYNAASELGWKLLRFSTEQVKSGQAILKIREIIKNQLD